MRILPIVLLAAALAPATAGATTVKVLASKLDQPKKITVAADGGLVVALSGDGKGAKGCNAGKQSACADRSGAVVRVDPSTGAVRTLASGLSSVASAAGSGNQATGPVEAIQTTSGLDVLFQSSTINTSTGKQVYGSKGNQLGRLYLGSTLAADFAAYEAQHNPDKAAGSGGISSDPYAVVPYDGGYAIADAGGNDVLFVSAAGAVSVLAVLPTIKEDSSHAQSVPDALAVGPDGALYVGELGGAPYARKKSSVYRIVPGATPAVYARGFTAITDIAFDKEGRLLVLEIDTKGLTDAGFSTGTPHSGAIIRVGRTGAQTTLVGSGLTYPTGLAVGSDGAIYVANQGIATGGGQVLKVTR